MAEQREILTSNLLVDVQNPRLPVEQQNQLGAIRAMLATQSAKTLALVEEIATQGFSRIERLFVTPSSENPKLFIVLEGNRRLTALKLLSEPKLGDEVLSTSELRKLNRWSDLYRNRGPVKTIECLVFGTREDANPWIERRHVGDQGGVGIVRWGATEAARFNARRQGKRSRELQVLDYVANHSELDKDTRDRMQNVSITNLKRLISDAEVRKHVGLEIDDNGGLLTTRPESETIKPLRRIIHDLAFEKIKVKDIYTAEDRRRYLKKISSDLPSPTSKLGTSRPLSDHSTSASRAISTPRARSRVQAVRKVLIPSDCTMKINNPKILQIYRELRRLELTEFSNAVAVLFRVFLELSVDHAIEAHTLMPAQETENTKLRNKINRVAVHLEDTNRLSRDQARAAKAAAQDQHLLHTTVTTLHQYVHNKHFSPRTADLRASWDNLQPFLEAIWN